MPTHVLTSANIRSQEVKLLMSPIQLDFKDSSKVGLVKNSFYYNSATTSATTETIVYQLFTGHPVTLAYLQKSELDNTAPSSKSTFVSQQILGVDIDNHTTSDKYPDGVDVNVSVGGITTFCQTHGLSPLIIYPTYSSTVECPRLRVLFVLSQPITDRNIRQHYIESLTALFLTKYRYTDVKCCNIDRLFYGTTMEQFEHSFVDCEAVNDIAILDKLATVYQLPSNPVNYPKKTQEQKQSRQGSVSINPHRDNSDHVSLYGCPLTEWLSSYTAQATRQDKARITIWQQAGTVPFELYSQHSVQEGMFNCEFHHDSSPSAHIYVTDNGEYRYKCFSCGCSLSGVDYLVKRSNITKQEALDIVMRSRNLTPIQELIAGLQQFRKQTDRTDYNKLHWYQSIGAELLETLFDMALAGVVIGNEVWVVASARVIQSNLQQKTGLWRDKESTFLHQLKKLASYGGIVRVVTDDEFAQYDDLIVDIEGMSTNLSRCNVYSIPLDRTFDQCMETILVGVNDRKQNGIVGQMTQDSAIMSGNTNSMFQDARNTVSKGMQKLLPVFEEGMKLAVAENGYVTKQMVMEYKPRGYGKKSYRLTKLNEAWPHLVKKLGLELVTVNNKTREKHNLPGSNVLPTNSRIAVGGVVEVVETRTELQIVEKRSIVKVVPKELNARDIVKARIRSYAKTVTKNRRK